jgi:hypothetical protein
MAMPARWVPEVGSSALVGGASVATIQVPRFSGV